MTCVSHYGNRAISEILRSCIILRSKEEISNKKLESCFAPAIVACLSYVAEETLEDEDYVPFPGYLITGGNIWLH